MISFENDYSEGCHESVLHALIRTNLDHQPGYGADKYTARAKNKIREAIGCKEAEIYFISGGTQTNQLVIDTELAAYEGVVCAESGHIAVHEAGAIEFSGHKVMTIPSHHGKVDPDEFLQFVEKFYADGNHEHMVFPGMLYISHPTEFGTLYSKEELTRLRKICTKYEMRLYVDGARLGFALAAKESDVMLPDLAKLCDVFYIGGTKLGALCGEALVFPKKAPTHFVTRVKQHGALMAKGRLIGIQFDALFTDGLYEKIGAHGVETAERLKEILKRHGGVFCLESPTNQQFVIMENTKMEALSSKVRFSYWEAYDKNHTIVRFATGFATEEDDLNELDEILSGEEYFTSMIDADAAMREPEAAPITDKAVAVRESEAADESAQTQRVSAEAEQEKTTNNSDLASRYEQMLREEQNERIIPGSILIKDTTKSQRIELIKTWIPADETNDECNIDLWDMYGDYIDGKREISQINADYHGGTVI